MQVYILWFSVFINLSFLSLFNFHHLGLYCCWEVEAGKPSANVSTDLY